MIGPGVLHELAHVVVRHLAADQPPGSDSNVVLLAIIGAVGLVLSTTVPVFLRSRSRPARPARHPLNSDDIDEVSVEEQLALANARIRALEIAHWRRRHDPNRIHTGEESDAEISF